MDSEIIVTAVPPLVPPLQTIRRRLRIFWFMAEYKVQFEVFEGPLDLLLYLIKKEEVDIYEVNLTKLATQFIEYIDLMRAFRPRSGRRIPRDGLDAHVHQEPRTAAR